MNGRGNKPLHFAVMYRRMPIVQYLLDLGADVDAAGEQGYTPLHISVKFNFPEIMELLLLRGARTDMITRDEKTARDMAKWGGENTTAAMEGVLELFDRAEAECKQRGAAVGQRYEPGAPLMKLQPRTETEPWLHETGGRRGGAPRLGGGSTLPTAARAQPGPQQPARWAPEPEPEPEPESAHWSPAPAPTREQWVPGAQHAGEELGWSAASPGGYGSPRQQPPAQGRSGGATDSLDRWQASQQAGAAPAAHAGGQGQYVTQQPQQRHSHSHSQGQGQDQGVGRDADRRRRYVDTSDESSVLGGGWQKAVNTRPW